MLEQISKGLRECYVDDFKKEEFKVLDIDDLQDKLDCAEDLCTTIRRCVFDEILAFQFEGQDTDVVYDRVLFHAHAIRAGWAKERKKLQDEGEEI